MITILAASTGLALPASPLFTGRRRFVLGRLLCLLLVILGSLGAASALADPAPVKVAIYGDSQAQGVAGAFERLAVHDRRLHVVNKTIPGTALSQRFTYDWVGAITEQAATDPPEIAILMFGGNDRLATRLEAGGKLVAYRTEAWRAAYADRITAVVKALVAVNAKVFWLGQPIARDPAYSSDMQFLNAIFAEAVPAAGGTFVPLWDIVVDDQGAFAAYGKGLDGQTHRMRQDDGVHFLPAGYDLILEKLKPLIGLETPPPPATPGLAIRS